MSWDDYPHRAEVWRRGTTATRTPHGEKVRPYVLVEEGVPCNMQLPRPGGTERGTDGVRLTGERRIFFEAGHDVRVEDRILVRLATRPSSAAWRGRIADVYPVAEFSPPGEAFDDVATAEVTAEIFEAIAPPPVDPSPGFDFSAVRGLAAYYDAAGQLGNDGLALDQLLDGRPGGLNLPAGPGGGLLYAAGVAGASLLGDGSRAYVRTNVPGSTVASDTEFSGYFLVNVANWSTATTYLFRWGSGMEMVHVLLQGGGLNFKAGTIYQEASTGPVPDPGGWTVVEVHKSGPVLEVIVGGVLRATANNAQPISTSTTGTLSLFGNYSSSDAGLNGYARHASIYTVNHTDEERQAIRSGLLALTGSVL